MLAFQCFMLLVLFSLCAADTDVIVELDTLNATLAPDVTNIMLSSIADYGPSHTNNIQLDGLLLAQQSLVIGGNSTLFRVNYNGDVNTILAAGVGYADGVGSSASFGAIYGLAWDTSSLSSNATLEHDIYVCDGPNHVIRKISTDLVVTTVAGSINSSAVIDGVGTLASFVTPSDICYSSYHKLYFIADTHIRSFDPATGNVTTVVLLPGLFSVDYISCGNDGTLYYSDSVSVIYKVIKIGTVEVITFPFVGMSGVTGCADGSGGAPRLRQPRALSAFSNGLFITQEYCASIRYVDTTGFVESLSGKFDGRVNTFSPSAYPGSHATLAGLPGAAVYDENAQALYVNDRFGVRVVYYTPPPAPAPPVVTYKGQGMFEVSWEMPTFKVALSTIYVEYSVGNTAGYYSVFSTNNVTVITCKVSAANFDWSQSDTPVVNFRVTAMNAYGSSPSSATAFTFDDVIIVRSVTRPPTAGGIVNITLFNMPELSNIGVLIGSTQCTGVTIYNAANISCNIAAGTGEFPVFITLNGTEADTLVNYAFKYERATITSVFPPVPTSGGLITVVGTNFGPIGTPIIVDVTNPHQAVTCANATIIIAHEVITCIMPEGTGANNDVSVNVSQLISQLYPAYSYQLPQITFIEGNGQVPTRGGSALSVHGYNFGPLNNRFLVAELTKTKTSLNSLCSVTFVNHTLFVCLVPKGSGTDNVFSVTVDYLTPTDENYLISYAAPSIISATTLDTCGGYVTITGVNFGFSTLYLSINVSNVRCTSPYFPVSYDYQERVICYMPAGTGGGKHISINVDSQSNTDSNTAFSYFKPYVSSISFPLLTGSTITIGGDYFGHDTSVISVSMIRKDGYGGPKSCTSVRITPYAYLTCFAPAGSGYQYANVTVDGQTTSKLFQYATPMLNYIGVVPVSDRVTITGSNFGSDVSLINVTLDNIPCVDVMLCYYYVSNCVMCLTPNGGGQVQMRLSVDGLYGSTYVSYASPIIYSVNRVRFGGQVTITGSNFGNDASQLEVVFGIVNYCTNVTLICADTIVCQAPFSTPYSYLFVSRFSTQSSAYYYSIDGTTGYSGFSTGYTPTDNGTGVETAFVCIIVAFVVIAFCLIFRYVRRSQQRNAAVLESARQSLLPSNANNNNNRIAYANASNYATFGASISAPSAAAAAANSSSEPREPRPVVDSVHQDEEGELVLCDICSENNKNTAMNCGHMTCNACSLLLKDCPFCKTPITSRHRVFLR